MLLDICVAVSNRRIALIFIMVCIIREGKTISNLLEKLIKSDTFHLDVAAVKYQNNDIDTV